MMVTARRCGDDRGASAVEYGLLLAAVAAVIAIIVFALGGAVRDMFTESCATIDSQVTPNANCGP
jgi:pilus assembly protein Flp/PilA